MKITCMENRRLTSGAATEKAASGSNRWGAALVPATGRVEEEQHYRRGRSVCPARDSNSYAISKQNQAMHIRAWKWTSTGTSSNRGVLAE